MNIKAGILGIAIIGLLATNLSWAADKTYKEPDYTKGESFETLNPKQQARWNLGVIGAEGNFWANGESRSGQSRMIEIETVYTEAPATNLLRQKDVILGIISPTPAGSETHSPRFKSDARHAFAAAIAEAERKENGGRLVLNIWRPETEIVEIPLTLRGNALKEARKRGLKNYGRIVKKPLKGKNIQLTITLPVKGSYSSTSPWNCEKTQAMISEETQAILKTGLFRLKRVRGKDGKMVEGRVPNASIDKTLNALGLLATGDPKHISLVGEYARGIAKNYLKLDMNINLNDKSPGRQKQEVNTWYGSYHSILLSEYYLLTKDESVLPGLKALAAFMAMGQSGVGTWSHGISYVKLHGLYGPPAAYGAMNACSVVAAISLVLAQKCGIKNKAIDDAVVRSLNFYRWYVDKGTVPYGDNTPAIRHDANGKNSMTAVFFDLAGEAESADYFTRMTLASYNQREFGHTGHYFSWIWGAPGAARGGPEAAQFFAKKTRFFTEMERRPNGMALHNQLKSAYGGWNRSGARLLQFCVPLKKLYITGKGSTNVSPISRQDLKKLELAAKFNPEKLTVKELLAALEDWSVVVRNKAAKELGQRDENVVKELIGMLDSPNRYARYGACNGLANAGRESQAAVDALVKKLETDADLSMRWFAVKALRFQSNTLNKHEVKAGRKPRQGLGEAVKKSMSTLLKLAANYEPKKDPMRKLHWEIAEVLFRSNNGYFPSGKGIEKVDRALLIPALKSLLKNPSGWARTTTSKVYDYLGEDDLKQLWGDIYYASKRPAPSGSMAADGVRMKGAGLLAKHRTKEGLEIANTYVFGTPNYVWGTFARLGPSISSMKIYGQALKEHFPTIKKYVDGLGKSKNPRSKKQHIKLAKEFMEMLNTPESKELKSLQAFIEAYEKEQEEKSN